MSDSASFGDWIRRRRRALDLTREALARQVGCAIVTIRKIESDERRPSRQVAERLAESLQIPPTERAAFLQAARAELAVDRLPTPPAPPLSTPPDVAPAPARRPMDRPPQEQAIKGYELREQIGAGGFGTVYRATQPGVGREVAVKIVRPEHANHPEFIRRFEAEAQLVARLEHPYIVPLYDYWREGAGAYLVMRYIRGGSLQAALQSAPWPLERCTRLLEQIAAALAFAHRHGVVHRDLKPANILLDDEGHAYLADFGIAKDLRAANAAGQTQPGAIVGSPEYLSPEQIKDEPVTPQTDIYSLGMLLYETLSGVHPFAGLPPAERMYKQLHEPFPPLQDLRPDLPAALNAVLQRATAKQPADRYPDLARMVAEWQQANAPGQTPAPEWAQALTALAVMPALGDDGATPGTRRVDGVDSDTLTDLATIENPYKGLRAFTEADATDFFGREALTQELLERLAEESVVRGPLSVTEDDQQQTADQGLHAGQSRFLAVVGPSGSGKSSVVRAGLVPALRQGGLPGSERWFVVELFPGAHPLEELEAALLRIAINPPESLLGQLREDERGLARAVKRALPADTETELVLVIDQFEELWTLTQDEAARAHVLASLHAAVTDPRSRVRVIVTLRADFTDRPLLHADVGRLLQEHTAFVLPLTLAELERAITGPTQRVGLALEPELTAVIARDVGEQPGALPLLQYALTELFERRQGRVLTHAAYQASGGVLGALARRSEELYADLTVEQQEAARQLFLRLVTPGEGVEDTRRRVRRSELGSMLNNPLSTAGDNNGEPIAQAAQPSIDTVIDRYGRARLLTFDRDPITREPTVEVAHEALIRTWGRLRAWLDASREDVLAQRRLTVAAAEWANTGHDPSFLATGVRLVQFEALAQAGDLALNAEERAYLEASVAEREARGVEEIARQRRELDLQKRATNRLRYLVGALTLFLLVAAILTAFAFNQSNIARRNAAESQNLALVSGSQAALANGNTDQAIALALQAVSLDPSSLKAQVALGEAAYAPGTIRQFVGHTGGISGVAFSPDGRTALSGSDDMTLIRWDIQTGQLIRRFAGHTGPVNSVAISPDGRTALSGSDDTTLILWDIATGKMIRRFEGHTDKVHAVSFSPDGRAALSGSNDKTMILWDIQTGKIAHRFEGHSDAVESVKFSPDGHRALSGSDDTTLILWDIATGAIIRRFAGHIDRVTSVAFSPDSQTILSGSADDTVILWDIKTGQIIHHFYGPVYVQAVAFSPANRQVLSGGVDTTLILWDIVTGQQISRLHGHESSVNSVAFSPDGRLALSGSGDGTMRLWDLQGGQVIRRFNVTSYNEVAFSPDGHTALVSTGDAAMLVDVQTGEQIRRYDNLDGVTGVDYAPDGRTALLAINGGISDAPKDVVLWDVETGQEIRRFAGHPGGVWGVDFSPDGRTAVSSGSKGAIILWDVATGQAIRRFPGYEGSGFGATVFSAAFSPDGRTILTGFGDGKLILWDVATGQQIRRFVGHTDLIWRAVFSPDGQHAFSGAHDNTAIYWDVATGAIVHRFTDHSAALFAVQISPDGRFGLGGSADNTTILWDLKAGEAIRRYTGANAGLRSAAFSSDGRSAVVVDLVSGSVGLWRIDPSLEELVAWTHANRYIPELTCEQRALYRLEPLCSEQTATPASEVTPTSGVSLVVSP